MSRARMALPLVLTYWVVLLFGLVLYSAARRDQSDIVAILWAGSVFGTLVGHLLGLTNVRLWFTAIVVGGLLLLGLAGPASPDRNIFWMSFAPAVLFAALSVGDRWSLAAFWFPAMIWMLTILDNTHGKQTPDGTAAVTLGALALAFVVFLRVRETRRVALWRSVGTAALAKPTTSTVFKEPPGKEIGRAGWMLATSAMVFAFTAWLAPQLWEVETFGADPMTVASNNGPAGAGGPPCCEDILEAERSRVKEYFDFGRGKDSLTGNGEESCRKCSGEDEGGGGEGGYAGRIDWHCTNADFEAGYCVKCTPADIEAGLCVLCTDDQINRDICVYGRWIGSGGGYGGGGGGGGTGNGVGGTNGTGNGNGTGTGIGDGNGYAGNHDPDPTPAPTPRYEPPTQYEPPAYTPPPPPSYTPPIEPVPMPDKVVPEPQPEPPTPEPQVAAPEPVPTPPTPAPEPSYERPAPSPSVDHAQQSDRPAPSVNNRTQKASSQSSTSELMRWLSAFIAAVIALQLLRFLFRPLRRAISLRHLRKPFWEETVDQRVSNWWQLVLVGLRDAGYRTTSDEQPREFARRTGIEGVETCAAILDRTRHGIRIDDGDLDEMAKSAEVAYRSARENTSTLARAAAQIRWPLA